MSEKINISEAFYSVQCEGHTTGVPAYFIRLPGCNLLCGNPCGGLKGDVKTPGENATWICDTIDVWSKSNKWGYNDLVKDWINEEILEWVLDGRVHLVWTGGEPTTKGNQRQIVGFLEWLETQTEELGFIPKHLKVYNELETNGTLFIDHDLFFKIDQINCSVKLANSGMPKEKRINRDALIRIKTHCNYWFKFVISNEDDMFEIEKDFIEPFNIDPKRVLLMPGLDKQKNFHERTRFCLEMAKRYGYVGLSRLHISAWDQLTGV